MSYPGAGSRTSPYTSSLVLAPPGRFPLRLMMSALPPGHRAWLFCHCLWIKDTPRQSSAPPIHRLSAPRPFLLLSHLIFELPFYRIHIIRYFPSKQEFTSLFLWYISQPGLLVFCTLRSLSGLLAMHSGGFVVALIHVGDETGLPSIEA